MDKIFCGRLLEKKDWMVASISFSLDELNTLIGIAEANNGFVRLDICNNKNGDKTFCCIDTYKKVIPEEVIERESKKQEKYKNKPRENSTQSNSYHPQAKTSTEQAPF